MKLRSQPAAFQTRAQSRGLVGLNGAPLQRVKVAAGYPVGSSRLEANRLSIQALALYELSKKSRGEEPLLCAELPQSGLYIDHNRNRIAEKFIDNTTADWLLQIDSDISFPETIIESLLAVAGSHKIVAASVPLGHPYPSCAWKAEDTPGVWSCIPEDQITPDGIECDVVATAVVMIHREVFEAIADREGRCWFLKMMMPRLIGERSIAAWQPAGRVRDREWIPVGEDNSFCLRARDAGYRPLCVKIPGLNHHKTHPFTHDDEPDQLPRQGVSSTETIVHGSFREKEIMAELAGER